MAEAAPGAVKTHLPEVYRQPAFRRAVVVAAGLGVGWWLVAVAFGRYADVLLWADQRTTFTQAVHSLRDPYASLAWPYVPWAAVLMIPFGLVPVELAVLVQMVLYCVLLAAVIYRFGGGLAAVLITLTSAIAFDTALEINMEWIVVLGLLVPHVWSGPLLLVKPQAALGYWLGFEWREWLRGGLVVLAVIAVALILWPGWVQGMWADIQVNTLGEWGSRINLAFSHILPRPIAWLIGGGLAGLALWRQDPVLGVFAWLFFVPYITLYSLLPAFALLAARWPRPALVLSGALWLVYGRVLIPFLLAV
ncbi:MAG: hypothetical protein Kow0077_09220 [Anaerolineae bacterium]